MSTNTRRCRWHRCRRSRGRKVCWDQNVADLGGHAWTEVLDRPRAAKIADGDLTHVNPSFVSVDNKTKQLTPNRRSE